MKWWTLLTLLTAWQVTGFCLFGRTSDPGPVASNDTAVGRIVSLAPNLTEILFALGLDREVVGVTVFSDYPAEARAKPKVGSFWNPNMEAIVASEPDLVVTLGFGRQVSMCQRLRRMNIRARALHIETVDQLLGGIGELGVLTGRSPQARQLQQEMTRRLAVLKTTHATAARVSVLWVVQRDPLRVAGRSSMTQELIERAGGINALGHTPHKYPPIGIEQAMLSRPDVIIEQSMTGLDRSTQLKQAKAYWERFHQIPAVRDGRIYVIDGDNVSRLGPRICAGIEAVARCLHGPVVVEGR